VVLSSLAFVLVLAACGGKSATAPTTSTNTATSTTPHRSVSHAAPGLERLLPGTVAGHRLQKGSATGAVVLSGSNAFSAALRGILARAGKQASDLQFANAQDPTGAFQFEVGAFRVRGLAAPVLSKAIVRSSRPNAPGLQVTTAELGGAPVTKVVYPGGSTLYLYPHGGVVYYVGTQDEAVAARVIRGLP
jgi:hypothetical protein